jgi:sugar phosphate isomerase/epimerase
MPEFIIGARGHDFGRHSPMELFSSIGQAGFRCTQLAYTKSIEGVKSYGDVTPAVVQATKEAIDTTGVQVAVYGTYVEIAYADEDKRKAEVAKVISQIGNAKLLGAGCMGSETTNMAKQPDVTRKEAQHALLRSLEEILPLCEEQGVLYGIECVFYHSMNTPDAVKMVLDSIASPNLRVICDLANYIGPEDQSLDAQRRMWDRVANLYGDKIAAVHFKGQGFTPDGGICSTSLEESAIDYAGGFAMLRQLPQQTLPVLREEAVPARAASDIAYMSQFFHA